MKKFLIFLFILSQVLLFYFALTSTDDALSLAHFYSGYPMHVMAFFGTTFLLYLVLKYFRFAYPEVISVAYSIFMGALIEVMQSFFGRQLSVLDFGVDILGALLAIIFIKLTPSFMRLLEGRNGEDSLYSAMILSLIAGIVIVIVSLIIMRPQPEYFTEIYYPRPDSLKKFIEPNTLDSFDITINNHENASYDYHIYASATLSPDNRTVVFFDETREVEKDGQLNLTIDYTLEDFSKAKIQVELKGKDQEIHFFVYNKEKYIQYPDYMASISCLNKTSAQGNVIVKARGTYSPRLKIFQDGTLIDTLPLSETSQEFDLGALRGYIEFVFDDDYYNQTAGIDRNIMIEKVTAGNMTLQGIYDFGKDAQSVDCENIRIGQLNSNGAYRMWLG
jgi:hypothetical protein